MADKSDLQIVIGNRDPKFAEKKRERNFACADCAHFSASGVGGQAECRIKAPQVVWLPLGPRGELLASSAWPPTRSDHWCGEHKLLTEHAI
jgi:hypothetical protein